MLVIIYIILTSCCIHNKKYWAFENQKISNCRNAWIYNDLLEKRKIRVLLFYSALNQDINSYPNFIIGITESNDTFACLDKTFIGKLKKGETINVLPYFWSSTEKETNKPLFVIHKKPTLNNLYCNVDTVYFCKIEKIKGD